MNKTNTSGMAGNTTRIIIFTLDLLIALVSYYFAILVTHNFDFSSMGVFFTWTTVLLAGLRVATSVALGTHSLILRYIGDKDYIKALIATTLSSVAFGLLLLAFPGLLKVDNKRAILAVDFIQVSFLTVVGVRMGMKILYDQYRLRKKSSLNTVIFGAGELGSMIEKVLRYNGAHNYRVVAFFDDNRKVRGKSLSGIPVFDPRKSFAAVVRKYDIKVAIIGINRLDEKRRIEFINQCLAHNIQVLKIPPVESWINGTLNIGQLRNINFEDLLNRPPIRLDEEAVEQTVNGKIILVTGCAGSIGSEIVRQLLRYRPQLIIGLDQAETPLAEITLELKEKVASKVFKTIIGDVKDQDKLFRIFQEYQPDYVFHAAAYKHVPIMEAFPDEAIKANVMGTRNVADLAVQFEVEKFVMISTDKVIKPGNIMGASKRIAEMYVQSLNYHPDSHTQFITTRFGNVLGSNGSVIPIFKAQIETGQDVTVTHPDVTRYFMTIPEACQLVLEAGAIGQGGEIFVFDMGEPVRIVTLAENMIRMAGLKPGKDIKITFTGLRPGEKLTEELFDVQEGLMDTHHEKIQRASVRPCDYEQIKPGVEALISGACSGLSDEILVKRMKEIVPEFASQNSVFSALDKQPRMK